MKYSRSNTGQQKVHSRSPGGLRWTAESMATMRPACAPAVQKRTLWGLPRQPSAAQGNRSALPSSMSSRNSLRAHTVQLASCSFLHLARLQRLLRLLWQETCAG